jgi:hypothetical protein
MHLFAYTFCHYYTLDHLYLTYTITLSDHLKGIQRPFSLLYA